jgi:hypothetical protein
LKFLAATAPPALSDTPMTAFERFVASKVKWLGVRDDFRNWLIHDA